MKHLLIFAILLVGLSSCVPHRQLINFRGEEGPTLDGYTRSIQLPGLEVQPDDILYITVNSLNDATSRPYNLAQSQTSGGAQQEMQLLLQGYSVDSSGYIDFPNIGRISVGGLTLEGAREAIVERLQPFLNSPAVNVKFLNFRYSMIGEVAMPGTYSTINERISLLEAISTAGDLTDYANRNRVFVIREKDGIRTSAELDLQRQDFLESPYYYLQQNDVVYVEPTTAKVATVADPASRFISYGSAFLSVVALVATLLLR